MATKRPAPEDSRPPRPSLSNSNGNSSSSSSSSRTNGPKRRKPNHFPRPTYSSAAPALQHSTTAGRPFKKAHPVNELKSQIRSLRRLLSRADSALPANVRVEKERALRTAEHELAAAQRAQTRSTMIGKWHKVRFFERQKAAKRLKRARKALGSMDADEGGRSRREAEVAVENAEVEVNYAVFFPLEREYVPLFYTKVGKKRGGEDGDGEEVEDEGEGERKGDAEMWELVKRCMADGTLKDLRDGRLEVKNRGSGEDEVDGKEKKGEEEDTRKRRRGTGKSARGRSRDEEDDAHGSDESDNESGGGFFE